MRKIITGCVVVVKLAMFAEVSGFLNGLPAGYLAFGSACWKENTGGCGPIDVDVLLCEPDPTIRLNLEEKIDKYNRVTNGLRIDDTLTRVGTVYFGKGLEMYIHGRERVYRMRDWQEANCHGLNTMAGTDLVRFSKSLVDGRQESDQKARATINGIGKKFGLDPGEIGLAEALRFSPRDTREYSFWEMRDTIKAGLGQNDIAESRLWLLTLRRMSFGTLAVRSPLMQGDMEEKGRIFSRFYNFGRRLNLMS